MTRRFKYIGRGLYSLPEAERLTRIPTKRLRRWLEGYSFLQQGDRHVMPPVIDADIGRDAGVLALSFQDMLEVRFLDQFREMGVSLRSIRIAAANAQSALRSKHPFSSRRFKTDGRSILLEIARPEGLTDLLNLVSDQWEIAAVVVSMLSSGVDYANDDEPERWWPLTRRRSVVIDPQRSFGAPIIDDVGVPTSVLAAAAKAEGSHRAAASWYQVSVRAVRHAVEFEKRFAA